MRHFVQSISINVSYQNVHIVEAEFGVRKTSHFVFLSLKIMLVINNLSSNIKTTDFLHCTSVCICSQHVPTVFIVYVCFKGATHHNIFNPYLSTPTTCPTGSLGATSDLVYKHAQIIWNHTIVTLSRKYRECSNSKSWNQQLVRILRVVVTLSILFWYSTIEIRTNASAIKLIICISLTVSV